MKEIVKLKFDKGDIVTIRVMSYASHKYNNGTWRYKNVPEDKEYTIDGYRIIFEKDNKPLIQYVFHAYLDEYVGYNDFMDEEILIPVGENHPHDVVIEAKDVFGEDVSIGDQVYCGLYSNYDGATAPTKHMSFIGGGNIDTITYGYNLSWCNGIIVTYKRNFLTVNKDGMPYTDARKEGETQTESIKTICKKVPDTFYKDIVDNANCLTNYLYDQYDSYTFKCIMEHFGQYDKACAYLKKKETELSGILSKLQNFSDTDIKLLLNILKLGEITTEIQKLSKVDRELLINVLLNNTSM